MKGHYRYSAFVAVLALAACGSGDKDEEKKAAGDMMATEEAAPEKGTMDAVMEKAAEMAEAIKLDTSSLDAFKASLADMKASLGDADQSKLMSALSTLAKGTVEEKGGMMGAAKDMMAGKSLEETLYEKMASKLDGMTFEDVLALAG